MVNRPLIRPYLLGGVALGGVPLDSHESDLNSEMLNRFPSKKSCMKFGFGSYLGPWWFLKLCFIFIPNVGEDDPILTIIFFKWVETTNDQVVKI